MFSYSMERIELHKKIIDSAFLGKGPGLTSPSLVFLGGGMLTGKTGMRKVLLGSAIEYLPISVPEYPRLKPEETVVIYPNLFDVLPEFQAERHVQHPEKMPMLLREYYDLCQEIIVKALSRGISVIHSDHLDDLNHTSSIISETQGMTSNILLILMSMDPIKLLVKIEQYAKEHMVRIIDAEQALQWQLKAQSNWEVLSKLIPHAVLFNTDRELLLLATKEGELRRVVNQAGFSDFVKINDRYSRPLLEHTPLETLTLTREKRRVALLEEMSHDSMSMPEPPTFRFDHDFMSLLSSQFLIWIYQESLRQRKLYSADKLV